MRNCSCRDLTQVCLKLAVRQLDRIKIRRVFREIPHARLCLLNRLPNGRSHVNSAVVHQDDVVAPQGWNQALINIGAVILLWRKAATKVIVSHDPSGTAPITLTPLGARPLSRTRFVLTAVSSIKTSRAESRKPCSRIQRRRARATSSRCLSVACRLFFKGDVVTVEKTPERAAAGSNSPLAQLCKRLHQGQVWMLSNHSQNLGCELFEWRNASAARLRSGPVKAVQQRLD